MTLNSVTGGKAQISGKELQKLHAQVGELMRRVMQGTLTFKPTAAALQDIIEGKYEQDDPGMMTCEARNGNRCTICNAFFGDGDDICANGHQFGSSYPISMLSAR